MFPTLADGFWITNTTWEAYLYLYLYIFWEAYLYLYICIYLCIHFSLVLLLIISHISKLI